MDKVFVTVSQNAVHQAEQAIDGCHRCSKDGKVSFSRVLHSFRHYREEVEYILPVLAQCPRCLGDVDENTIVKLKNNPPISQGR